MVITPPHLKEQKLIVPLLPINGNKAINKMSKGYSESMWCPVHAAVYSIIDRLFYIIGMHMKPM